MSVKMKFGSKDIPFVYKGNKLVYPNPIKDGLLLWYDFKGMRNTDTNKEVAKDLSENGNDGTLTNFNFTEGSGYKDNTLVFDGVDDKLIVPELELDETAMSVMYDGKIYSYEDDKVLAIKDYSDKELTYLESLRAKGRNLLRDSYFKGGSPYFSYQMLNTEFSDGTLIATNLLVSSTTYPRIICRPLRNLIVGEKYTISFKAKADSEFSASFWVSDVNGGNSQFAAKMTSYTKKWEIYSYTFTVNERFSDSTAIQWWVNKTNPDNIQTLYLKEVQLEKGITATDWSPAPEDVRENLPGLEAGGRNLFLNSDFSDGLTKWTKDSIEAEVKNGALEFYNPDPSFTRQRFYYNSVQLPLGEKYVVSFNAKAEEDGVVVRISQGGTGSTMFGEVELTTDMKRYSIVFESANNYSLSFHPVTSQKIITFDKVQLEKGTIATDWTPAPEDFQTTSLSSSSLSNLQLYNRPLRKDELLHNVESGGLKELVDGVIVQDGLVLHYDFSHENNASEYKDKAFDYSGNGNHGVLNNFNFTEESGYEGEGLKYDNVDDFVKPNLSERVTDFTILSTVYFSEAGNGMIWGGIPSAFYLRRNLEHALHGSIYISGGEGIAGKQLSTYVSNVFVANEAKKINVGMIVDNESQTYSLIVNGEIVRSIDISNELKTAPFLLTHVGTWPTLNYANLDGSMHSFQMYNRVLTPEEIAHNYQIEKEKFDITEGDI